MAAPKKHVPHSDEVPKAISNQDRRSYEMARRRHAAIGAFKGQMKLSLEDALAPMEESDLDAWGLGKAS